MKKNTLLNHYIAGIILSSFIFIIIVIVISVSGGRFQARYLEMDKKRLEDFATIKSLMNTYYSSNKHLPEKLSDLDVSSYSYTGARKSILQDPETGKAYEYKTITKTDYNLCTVFSANGNELDRKSTRLNSSH